MEGVRVLGIRVTVKLGIWVSRTQLETRPLFPTSRPVLWFHMDTELQGNITYPSGLAPHSALLTFPRLGDCHPVFPVSAYLFTETPAGN